MARSELNIILRLTDKASRGIKNASKSLSGFEKVAAGAGLALVAAGAAAVAFGVKSVKLAARVETLGVVTKVLGKNIGLTESEIRGFERAIVDQGITLKAARQSMAQMIQANIDLGKAADIARLAQNAAVIAGVDSSEAFQRVITTIQTANVRMGRTIGLQLNFNEAYKKGAREIGKTADELTVQEKAQIRANHVLEQGTNIQGAYTGAMKTAGKQALSTRRHVERLMDAIGSGALPVYAKGVTKTNEFISNLADLAEHGNEVAAAQRLMGVTLDDYMGYMDRSGNIIAKNDQELLLMARRYKDIWNRVHDLRYMFEEPLELNVDVAPAERTIYSWGARTEAYLQGFINKKRKIYIDMEIRDIEELQDLKTGQDEEGPGGQHGGTFTVPPGYPNDSFPMRVSSGERVSVDNSERSFFGGSTVNINNGTQLEAFEEMLRTIQ